MLDEMIAFTKHLIKMFSTFFRHQLIQKYTESKISSVELEFKVQLAAK